MYNAVQKFIHSCLLVCSLYFAMTGLTCCYCLCGFQHSTVDHNFSNPRITFCRLLEWAVISSKILWNSTQYAALNIAKNLCLSYLDSDSHHFIKLMRAKSHTNCRYWLHFIKPDQSTDFYRQLWQGFRASLKVLEFFPPIFKTLAVLENRVGAWKSLNLEYLQSVDTVTGIIGMTSI